MEEYTHTPGPWMIFPGGDIGSAAVRRPEMIVIKAGTVKGENIGTAMKNAKLIAAAPELLEACKYWLEDGRFLVANTKEHTEAVEMLRAAIAKAEATQ